MKNIISILFVFASLFSFGQNVHVVSNNTGHIYYVKDYGAKGDSSTDDRAAIIRCFTAAKADSSAVVFFADGRYVISDSIIVPTGLTIHGTSSGKNSIASPGSLKYPTGSVIIVNSTNHAGFVINSAGACCITGVIKPVQIFGLSFLNVSSSTPTSNSAGIRVTEFQQFTLRDCRLQGFYINLEVIGANYWTTDNCSFADAVLYQMSVGDNIVVDNGDQFVSNCLFESLLTRQPRSALYYHSGGGMKITNCKFNKWDADDFNRSTYSILVEMTGATSDFLISNTSFENFDSTAIRINQVGSTTFYNLIFSNIQIATNAAKGPAIKIVGGGTGDFGVLSLSNYSVSDYGGVTNSNHWIELTNTNYVNIGVGTVRNFTGTALITGGTNIQSIYDPIANQWHDYRLIILPIVRIKAAAAEIQKYCYQ